VKHRLCLPELAELEPPGPGAKIPLSSEHSHYLGRVLRLRAGAEIGIFDGAGNEWPAEVAALESRNAEAILGGEAQHEPKPTPLTLVSSWLKGSAMDTVVQKAVELGATAIQLLDAERSQYKADAKRRANKLTHLNKIALSAAEQCETRWLPEIAEAGRLPDLLARDRTGRTLFLELGGKPLTTDAPEPLTLIIGPEGGWSDAERSLVESEEAVEVVGLGPLTLRAETVPLAVLAAIRQSWGWQRWQDVRRDALGD
jgi:16S rRNA (uracil1498-N3)-methyltransferase